MHINTTNRRLKLMHWWWYEGNVNQYACKQATSLDLVLAGLVYLSKKDVCTIFYQMSVGKVLVI
jgi:hypothetical protein